MIKLRNSKNGQVQFLLENTFRTGFLIIALLVFFVMINFYINNKIDTKELRVEVFNNKILYSAIIMYEDSNGQIYPGIIDMNKFDTTKIESRINYQIPKYATAKLEIINNKDSSTIKTEYLSKTQYESLEVLVNIKGKGGSSRYIKTYPITYLDSGKYNYGTLRTTIIVPNS